MNVVIYARFSSHSQTEQSIEGQLKVCYEYARQYGHVVIGEYIDRAQSGTTDNRSDFQRMIEDSEKHAFQGVLVYQLDRFARNRYDSAINKAKLKKNGVRVLSAKENITDDASGILVEGVLESMAEYYSVELAQKITRGMQINAQKCLSNGSNPGLGYKVNKDRTFSVDEEEAQIVREIFERYAAGDIVADIIRDLNARQYRTSRGKEFNKNSINRILHNRRYIGYYIYKGEETAGGMPRIIDDALFERVQAILEANKKAPGRTKGKMEYLLTTKLFCGHCKEPMTGYGGTSKTGTRYHYYKCNGSKKGACKKTPVHKEQIEEAVIQECLNLFTDERIKFIADEMYKACQEDGDLLSIKRIQAAIDETEKAIENLWNALEQGQSVQKITERINMREAEKKELQKQLAMEQRKKIGFDYLHILAYLDYIRSLSNQDTVKKKALINIFVNSIYLYDDYYTIVLNGGNTSLTIENIPFKSIEKRFKTGVSGTFCSSSVVPSAPPHKRTTPLGWFFYIYCAKICHLYCNASQLSFQLSYFPRLEYRGEWHLPHYRSAWSEATRARDR